MDEKITNMCQFIREQEQVAKKYLRQLVNTDSYSYDPSSVNAVGEIIQELLRHYDIPFTVRENESYGNHIIATVKGRQPGKILLMGHQDTVFQTGTAAGRPFSEDGTFAYGPGVSDMKGSLVSMIVTAAAVSMFASTDICDLELLFTPDEEIGSPVSEAVIQERAADAAGVFNMEPARPDGSVVTSRKGSAHLIINVTGKAAHSGSAIEQGISAIDELAHKIIAIKQLMDLEKGVTVNIGTIEGGIANNTVAPTAHCTIHTGFWRVCEFEQLKSAIQAIADHSYIEGTVSVLTVGSGILPMEESEQSRKLFDIVKLAGEQVAVPVKGTATKGAADAGFAAALGVPTICGMGPVGGNWHSESEYLILDSLVPRMQLTAVSLLLYCRSMTR
ncbi:M20 family metallopeptidase [Sporosarcina trichiuri]|uniref:M20 family metallopeptidase n=1 Tax=Sporosarcina trichiuri TaxID=3056445 RepID=UPI0025B3F808|nr:M20 family metallopeptidase [Sporosarcina sp. 0.2-SM1T-5]WJY26378.1 M20 family metallopeptidase [Sporosarcina sp. 0.2-SM1T-5]